MRRIGRQNFGENNRRIYTANREARVYSFGITSIFKTIDVFQIAM